MLDCYKTWFQSHRTEILDQLISFLRFPSVSTDPEYRESLHACAQWVSSLLREMGFAVELWESAGHHPSIYATRFASGKGKPTLLFYQHYDVQPPDPLDEWKSPPFEPTIRGDTLTARGAVDNKGQCFYVLMALKAFFDLSPHTEEVNIKLLIEGEEESGSGGLESLLSEKREQLAADYLIVTDCDMLGAQEPSITLGTRGMAAVNLTLRNSEMDLHSGSLGGIALNPARVLTRLLASCFEENGKVAVPGFYDEVEPLPPDELASFHWNIDIAKRARPLGVKAFAREEGYSLLESNWIRPTLEINGLKSGYLGEGTKTIIPATATVKLSCRLVPKQKPDRVIQSVVDFFQNNLPPPMTLDVERGHGGEGFIVSPRSTIAQLASKAYEEVFQTKCCAILCGATIPIVPRLVEATRGELVMMGVGLPEDGMHAPNESFSLMRFEQGFLTSVQLLNLVCRHSSPLAATPPSRF